MNRYGKRCVLYPRVSTEMQVDGYSLEGQKNMLTRFADREEMIVVDTYEDAGKSGKSIEGRPAFQKMLRDIEDGLDIDYILVYKLSRFGRNAADILNSLELVQSYEEYAQAIKKRIGVQIDTKAVDKELEGYQAKLKEVDLNKTRLEREIDSLPADAKYRERKLHDMTLRLDSLYDVIVELEEKIEDARLRRDAIKQQAITLENIYKIMVNFDCVYNIINDEEKRNVVTALIKEIEIYRNDESEYPLKRIGLNFPVFKDGGEVTELLWDKGNTVETVARLERCV